MQKGQVLNIMQTVGQQRMYMYLSVLSPIDSDSVHTVQSNRIDVTALFGHVTFYEPRLCALEGILRMRIVVLRKNCY